MFDRNKFYFESLVESAETKNKIIDNCKEDVFKAIDMIIESVKNGGKIMFCGNGGSAADCQHLATEFVIRLSHDISRPAIGSIALTTDSSMLTAGGNDIGFENIFARQVEGLGRADDILICISTSGNSKNVLNAIGKAKEKKIKTISLSGGTGGKMNGICDVNIIIPSDNTQRIQEGHITLGHIICESVEREIYGN